MWFECECGTIIKDSTDYLVNKAHLIPDQDWFDVYDAIDEQVVEPVAQGEVDPQRAMMDAREIIRKPSRLMWQCYSCGRLYLQSYDRSDIHCFVPSDPEQSMQILRGRRSEPK